MIRDVYPLVLTYTKNMIEMFIHGIKNAEFHLPVEKQVVCLPYSKMEQLIKDQFKQNDGFVPEETIDFQKEYWVAMFNYFQKICPTESSRLMNQIVKDESFMYLFQNFKKK